MNDAQRAELVAIRQAHAAIESQVTAIGQRISALEETCRTEAREPVGAAPLRRGDIAQVDPAAALPEPMDVPPVIGPVRQPQPVSMIAPRLNTPTTPLTPWKDPQPSSPPPPAQDEPGSFEMRLGTYWLVRVGVVMVLTALVFFGNLAYQNFIVHLGPGGKLALLYLASFAMIGGGAWWLRRGGNPRLTNYAQVVFGGGLAAGYFTTYAAHYMPNLRVIASPTVAGVLLLCWAGFMAWIADRRKSEVLAVMAIVLAYYTSAITRVGSFTLVSNVILTGAAVFFLVRNRWTGLSYVSLVATYLSYAYWRFAGPEMSWALPTEGLWNSALFLMCYWGLFTAATFLSQSPRLAGSERAVFLTFNNGAFLALFLLTMAQSRQGGVWKFLLIYGAVLVALSELARRRLPAEPQASNMYLAQGLAIATAGLAAKFSGVELGLLLAAESVVLTVLWLGNGRLVFGIAAHAAGVLGLLAGALELSRFHTPGLVTGISIGAMLAANAWFIRRKFASSADRSDILSPSALFFSAGAVAIWAGAICQNTRPELLPLALMGAGVAASASVPVLRLRELAFPAQGYHALGCVVWVTQLMERSTPNAWHMTAAMALLVGNAYLWTRPEWNKAIPQASRTLAIASGWAAVAISIPWALAYFQAPDRPWVLGVAGALVFALAIWSKRIEALGPSAAYSAVGLLVLWFVGDWRENLTVGNLLFVVGLAAQQRASRRLSSRVRLNDNIHAAVVILCSITLWLLVTRWVLLNRGGFQLTVAWSLLAFVTFSAGLLFTERQYRWCGLAMLALGLGKVVLLDVWRLETLNRMLSFLALGIVLLVLGFIYNRYQDKIRQWL